MITTTHPAQTETEPLALEGAACALAALFGFSVVSWLDGWSAVQGSLFEAVQIGSLVGACWIAVLRRQRLRLLVATACILASYAGLTLLSILRATDAPTLFAWETLVRGLIAGFTAHLLASTPRQARSLLWGAVVGAAVVALGASMGFLGLDAVDEDNGRLAGPVGEPNFFAQFQAIGCVLAARLALSRASLASRFVAAACAALSLHAVVTTESRGALVALLATAAVLVVRHRGTSLRQALVVAVVVAVAVLNTSAGDRLAEAPDSVSTTLDSGTAEDTAVAGRLSENIAALHMFRDHPVFGVGYGQYDDRYLDYSAGIEIDPRNEEREAHNLHLEVLAETGVVGALFWLGVVATVLVGTGRARHDRDDRLAVTADAWQLAFIAWLLTSVFLHDSFPTLQWFLIGGGLAIWGAAPSGAADAPPVAVVAT